MALSKASSRIAPKVMKKKKQNPPKDTGALLVASDLLRATVALLSNVPLTDREDIAEARELSREIGLFLQGTKLKGAK